MKNKVVVTIAGQEYTMVAVEDEAYVNRCAAHVDSQLRQLSGSRLSQADAAVLTAMNIADEFFAVSRRVPGKRKRGAGRGNFLFTGGEICGKIRQRSAEDSRAGEITTERMPANQEGACAFCLAAESAVLSPRPHGQSAA